MRKWTFFGSPTRIDIELAGTDGGPVAPRESERLLGELVHAFRFRDPEARRLVVEILAALGVASSDVLRARVEALDSGSPAAQAVADELVRAAQSGRLVAKRHTTRTIIVPLDTPSEDVLGPESSVQEVPDDVYVLAAQVTLIGGTPLVTHPVRVLDPDTGAIVVDGLTTDETGLVRTTVPAAKTYRIEIVDQDPDWQPMMQPDPKHGLLTCEFRDASGSPLAEQDVTATGDDGVQFTFTTDEDGRAQLPVVLGHYQVSVGDQAWDAHAVLPRDAEGDGATYRFVLDANADGSAPAADPENRLIRLDDSLDGGAMA